MTPSQLTQTAQPFLAYLDTWYNALPALTSSPTLLARSPKRGTDFD